MPRDRLHRRFGEQDIRISSGCKDVFAGISWKKTIQERSR